ncbi:MAG: ribonuclease N [Proteobacteria bacterium]|jgi:ribonuclease T1|nr:ribonuclease N [Pseudomonadota bacterium]
MRRALAALAAACILAAVAAASPALAREHYGATARAEVAAADLPEEARLTLRRIHDGGPFPYERDGITFGNRERLLPHEPRGYYHEYTVRTPGVHNRGARRIICGGAKSAPDVCYYTDDHYRTFRKIRE